MRRLQAAAAVVLVLVVVPVGCAWGDAVPPQANGSGGCSTANTTCYPECAWEWGGAAELAPKPCPYARPVQAQATTVGVGNFPVTQPVSGSVTVGNLPAVQQVTVANLPATQTVHVDNTGISRIPVSAVCESSVPCVANGQASEVRVTNDASAPVPVGGVAPAWTAITMVFGIGVIGGLLVVR